MGVRPARNFVTPTGTTATLDTAGHRAARSSMVRASTAPSLIPGQATTWQFMVMPAPAKRSIIDRHSPALG